MTNIIRQPLAEGKGEAARFCLKEAGVQICKGEEKAHIVWGNISSMSGSMLPDIVFLEVLT